MNRWLDSLEEPWRFLLVIGVIVAISFIPTPYNALVLAALIPMRLFLP